MNSSPDKLNTLYPAFLSDVLEGIRTENKLFEKRLANLRSTCDSAWKRSSGALGQLAALSLSDSEKSLLSQAETMDAKATSYLNLSAQGAAPTGDSLSLLQTALDLFNKALKRMEELRVAYISRCREESVRKARIERERKAKEEEARRIREEEEARIKRERKAKEEETRRIREEEERARKAKEEEARRIREGEEARIRRERAVKDRRLGAISVCVFLVPLVWGVCRFPCWTFAGLHIMLIVLYNLFAEKDDEGKLKTPAAMLVSCCLLGLAAVIVRQAIVLHWTAALFGFFSTFFVGSLLTKNRCVLRSIPLLALLGYLSIPSPLIPIISRHPYLVGIPVGMAMIVWLFFLLVVGGEDLKKYYGKPEKK